MTTIAQITPGRVVIGVDTHKDLRVAVALDDLGRRIGETTIATSAAGYRKLVEWAEAAGEVEAFGVEGTGSYGAALARHLRGGGHRVVEVLRPNRQARRRNHKSDPVDAEAAARAVISGEATGIPKSGDDVVEMIRVLRVARSTARKARTSGLNALKSLVITGPSSCATSCEVWRALSWSPPPPACARGPTLRPSRRTRPHCGPSLAAARPSTPRSAPSTPPSPSSPPKPPPSWSRPSVSGQSAPAPCSSPLATTQRACTRRRRSPCSVAPPRWRHPQARRSAIASTVAATAKPTPRSIAS